MRRNGLIVLILIVACYIHILAQSVSILSNVERRVNNCALMLGITINNVLNNQQIIDVRAFADTLYQNLYTRSVDIKIGTKYMGKIYHQAFFALSEDQRINYPDIERCLAVAGKHEAFYTPPFIICAFYYAQWGGQQLLI